MERNAWADYYRVSRYSVYSYWEAYKKRQAKKGKTVDKLFSEESAEQLKREFQEYEQRYPYTTGNKNREWTKINSMIKRAQALDDMEKLQRGFPEKDIVGFPDFSFEEEYIIVYKHTSEYAHGESGLIQTLFETEGNVGSIIIGVSDHDNNVAAIGLCARYMLIIMYIFAHINGLDLNFIPQELERQGYEIPTQD